MIEGLCTLQSHPTRDPPYLIALTFYSLFLYSAVQKPLLFLHFRPCFASASSRDFPTGIVSFSCCCSSFTPLRQTPARPRASRTPSLRYGVRLSSPLWCLVPVLYSVNDRCNRTLPLGKSRLSPAQQGGHFTRSPFQWTGLQCSWQFSTLPPIPHRTFAWYDGHMSMLSCAACGHPGTSHEWNVRHERGACKVRHNGRRCMCSHYVPKTDERKPANRLIGRVLRRPKGR
jgi:hypothetical protein